ncbi:monovalent cation/H+ antiporter subunit D [Aquabacterium sp.]|uniref:monovalent cation/H+ antiporter subunit D n=1 Tax=Aquabacterium sp. TaxID=1872578 RepID=UPI0027BAD50C|nr:monovalent cation/H+ antiporter subunit D [Aquabacterium sp.]
MTWSPSALIEAVMPHLSIAPILLPLLTACVLLFLSEHRLRTKTAVSLAAALLNLILAVLLFQWTARGDAQGTYSVYLPSNWDVPFGIVLVLDRLSALMLLLVGVIGLMALLFAVARWHKAGAHFHPLFQIQLMGLNGAFLTGDLFNLFVFFEVMLAASYGLLLHGSGPARVKAGLHYLSVNLVASSLFLVGAAMIYGVVGSLNMADLAAKIPQVSAIDRPLLHAGCAILGVAFLTKAAMWPLNFWLVPAYSSASAPSGAIFALLTKVGVYVLLRLSTLWFSPQAGESAGFGSAWLVWGGMATLAFGALGMLASQRPARLAGYAVIVSSGTLMAMIGLGRPEVTAAALYYLPTSTFAIAAFFLLTELMDRSRSADPGVQRRPEDEEDHLPFALADLDLQPGSNLDDDEELLIGQPIPASIALLGLAFICCTLLVAGLPPLSGFVGKFAMLSALLSTPETGGTLTAVTWTLLGLVVLSGLFAMIALSRTGIRFFWAPVGRKAPVLNSVEYLPVAVLVGLCVFFTVRAEPLMRYARDTAQVLYQPQGYIDAVLKTQPRATPTNAERMGAPAPQVLP